MWADNRSRRTPRLPPRRQAGTTAVEFALLAIFFFTLVFGIIEVARMMYVFNTLQEVTRRAAAAAVNVYPLDSAAIRRVKQDAVLRDAPGELLLAAPVSDENIRIAYFALTRDPDTDVLELSPIAQGALPASAAANRRICMQDPNAPNCIRFVQVQICASADAGDCKAVTLNPLVPMLGLQVTLHKATTLAQAETLGYRIEASP